MKRPLEQSVIEALRAAATEATACREPDWSRLDRTLGKAAREAGSRSVPRRRATPAWAAAGLAAAAGIVVALWLLPGRDAQPVPGAKLQAAELHAGRGALRAETGRGRTLLLLEVTDSVDIDPKPAPGQVGEGSEIAVPTTGELRLALGGRGLVEMAPGTAATVWSLEETTATLSVESGTLLVDVPPGALARELTVVADRTTFQILFGTAEFCVFDGSLLVRVLDGEVMVEGSEGPEHLTSGVFQRGITDEWAPLVPWIGEWLLPADLPGRGAIAERPLAEPMGTLPRHVVREALDRVTPRIRTCYENVLKRHPQASASITARVRVGAGGTASVTGLSGAWSWPGLGECLTGALGAMNCPPPLGGPVDLVLPLRLVPEP